MAMGSQDGRVRWCEVLQVCPSLIGADGQSRKPALQSGAPNPIEPREGLAFTAPRQDERIEQELVLHGQCGVEDQRVVRPYGHS